jgi:hypothetical protein
MGRNNASKRQKSAEVLALKIYNQAGGERIERATAEAELTQWRAHPPTCQCGCCGPARDVSVSRVWSVLWGWQESIARTRRLARR